jgi:membrane-associated phospholipid phosphatase
MHRRSPLSMCGETSPQARRKPGIDSLTERLITSRRMLFWGLALALLTLLAIFAIDGPVARMVESRELILHGAVDAPINVIELVFGFPISKWATGFVLLVIALAMFAFARTRHWAWLLLYVSIAQLATRLIAGVLKNVFLRTRPFDAVAGESWNDQWFVDGGSSFPSGHAAHFFGLFFAISIAFPRLRVPFLVLAILVSASRVAVNDHYVSDVLGSAAIAAFVAYGLSRARTPLSRAGR